MAPPPVERHGGESTAGETTRSIPTPFLTKTYQLVDDPAVNDIISWSEDGSAFVVWNPTEFARDLLPKYFKHNNFSSFVRQLNTYGFRKVVSDRWEFSNECFRRGEKRLLCDIQRRKVVTSVPAVQATTVAVAAAVQDQPPARISVSPSDSGEEQVVSSTYSAAAARDAAACGSNVELVGENERLRNENIQLNKELTHMKSMCSNIYTLMSNFADGNSSSGKAGESESESADTQLPTALDLMPTGRCGVEAEETSGGEGENTDEANAELLGDAVGAKRGREDTHRAAQYGMELQLRQPGTSVKLEPLDDNRADEQHESRRVKQNQHCYLVD